MKNNTESQNTTPSNENNQNTNQDSPQDSYSSLLYVNPIHNKKKYRRQNKKHPKFIWWPFIVLLPMFLISSIINMITDKDKGRAEEHTAIVEEIQAVAQSLPHPLPDELYQNIISSPLTFIKDLNNMLALTPPTLLTLVDKTHALSENYAPTEISNLNDYSDTLTLNKDNLSLATIAVEPLIIMSKSALANNILLPISSTYRSYSYQDKVFNRWVTLLGETQARRESAEPGTSQHQLGTAIDFGSIDADFEFTQAGQWLAENAWKFGFSLSYPKNSESLTGYIFESWHYRYIGIPATTFETTYFNGYQQYMLEFIHYIPQESIIYQEL